MKSYIRSLTDRLQNIPPYSPQILPDNQDLLRLDNNENLQLSLSFMREIMKEAVGETDPRIYPERQEHYFVESLSEHLNVDPEVIVIGSGADGLLELISGTVMTESDTAIVLKPTFTMYEKLLQLHNRSYNTFSLRDDFTIDIQSLVSKLQGDREIVFLCSPNNPTGNQFSVTDIQVILESTRGLVLVDEAYVEFANESVLKLNSEYENLFILRTFSKVFGLAGMRLGYAVTNSALAPVIQNHAMIPYPVSSFSINVASKLLENFDRIEKAIKQIKSVRETLRIELNKFDGLDVFPSSANFLLLRVTEPSELIAKELMRKGIKIRVANWIQKNANFIRVTVPPVCELTRVLSCFKEVFER